MTILLLAIGLVLIIEGLVITLAPRYLEQVLRLLLALSQDQRRLIGLAALALGGVFVTLAQMLLR
ncbi:MAG: DUF2065 domain-containing protein [Roseinatronobacter sp.]